MEQIREESQRELRRITEQRGDPKIPVEELRRAGLRMSTSTEARLRWAFEFAARDLRTLTAGDWMNLRLEFPMFWFPHWLKIFSKGPDGHMVPLTPSRGLFPSKEVIERTHERFNALLDKFEKPDWHGLYQYNYSAETSFSLIRLLNGRCFFKYMAPDQSGDCVITLMKLLEEHGEKVRRCPKDRHGCGRWFLASRADKIYCSTTCVSRATTRNRRARMAEAAKQGKRRKSHGKAS